MKKLTIVFLASVFAAVGVFAQKAPVVGVVDVQRVLNDYTAFQSAVEKVRGSVAPVNEEIEKMRENLRAIVEEGQRAEAAANNPSLSEEARGEAQAKVQQLQQQLRNEQVKLQQFGEQAQALERQGRQEELAPLQEKALEAVKDVAADKGIDLVLPAGNALFVDDSLEITDAVIAVLNAGDQ